MLEQGIVIGLSLALWIIVAIFILSYAGFEVGAGGFTVVLAHWILGWVIILAVIYLLYTRAPQSPQDAPGGVQRHYVARTATDLPKPIEGTVGLQGKFRSQGGKGP